MKRFWTLGVLVVLVGACTTATALQPDAAVSPDASSTDAPVYAPDDGFGAPCTLDDGNVLTSCKSPDGLPGWCASTAMTIPSGVFLSQRVAHAPVFPKPPARLVCRRQCSGHYTGCPAEQTPIPTTGDQCVCLPPVPSPTPPLR